MGKRFWIPVMSLMLVLICLVIPQKAQAAECNVQMPTFSVSNIKGGTITDASHPGKTKLIIFYRTTCGNSQATVANVAESAWVSNSNMVVYAINMDDSESVATQQSFADTYGNGGKNILFCDGTNALMWKCLYAAGHGNSVSLPASFVVDSTGTIRCYETGVISDVGFRGMLADYVSGISAPKKINVSLDGYYDYEAAQLVLEIVNEERQAVGLQPLKMDQSLLGAAMQRAAECNVNYGHTRPNGQSCFTTPGFDGKMRGENIAAGYPVAGQVMTGWMNSPGHKANILTAEFTSIGVGVFYQGGNTYWVQLFSDKTATVATTTGQTAVTAKVEVQEEDLSFGTLVDTYHHAGTLSTSAGKTHDLSLWFVNPGFPYDDVNVNPTSITYTSSNPAVATVSSKGVVKALKGGTTNITMTLAGGDTKVTVPVQVKSTFAITTQPTNKSAAIGASISTKVTASGEGLKYTWYYKDTTMSSFQKSSQTTATYSTTMNSARSGRKVYCKITDKNGSTLTTNTVTLKAKVTITTQPANKSAAINQSISTTVKATGVGLKYTWYYKDTTMSSFKESSNTSATYSTTMNSVRSGRQVYCKITDKYGNTVKTNTVTLKSKVTITTQPANKSAAINQSISTTVKATGVGLKYVWYYKDTTMSSFKVSSNTSATYSITMNSVRSGRKVYCKITDQYGNVVQTNTVTLKAKVSITTQPTGKAAAKNTTISTTVKATGVGLKYTWYYKDKGMTSFKVSSTTSATYSTTMNSARSGRQVYCVITDQYGNTVKTNVVTLKMK